MGAFDAGVVRSSFEASNTFSNVWIEEGQPLQFLRL